MKYLAGSDEQPVNDRSSPIVQLMNMATKIACFSWKNDTFKSNTAKLLNVKITKLVKIQETKKHINYINLLLMEMSADAGSLGNGYLHDRLKELEIELQKLKSGDD